MIKTIIIEDEGNARASLKKMLAIVATDLQIVAETGNIKDAIDLIETHKPKLVFLDIELEDGTSFEILEQFESVDFKIIFTTAYSQYAVKAFKFSTIDYLLKPIDPMELQIATQKSIANIEKENYHQELINVLKENLINKVEKIIIKTTEQRYILNTADIIRLEADAAYTLFITKDQKITASKNLKYYQDLLGSNFIRCHQSHLVNSYEIKGVVKNKKLRLSNDELIPIASRKTKEIIDLLEQK